MAMDLMRLINPFFGGSLRARPIRRIDDGRKVDSETERDLRGLSERTLRDIGYTSGTR